MRACGSNATLSEKANPMNPKRAIPKRRTRVGRAVRTAALMLLAVSGGLLGCQSTGSDRSRIRWPWRRDEPSTAARDFDYGRIPPPNVQPSIAHEPLANTAPRLVGPTASATVDAGRTDLLPPQPGAANP
jgi:hypothetical protein